MKGIKSAIFVSMIIIACSSRSPAGEVGAVGDLYVACFGNSIVVQFDGETGDLVGTFAVGGGLSAADGIGFGPNGNLFVGSYLNGSVIQFNGSTGAPVGTFAGAGIRLTHSLVFGAKGNLFACGHDNILVEYHGLTGAWVRSIGVDRNPQGIAFRSNGNFLVTHIQDNRIVEYDYTTGARLGTFASGGGISSPTHIINGPDGNLFVASGGSNNVLEYDGDDGTFLGVAASGGTLLGPNGLAFGPNGNLFVSSSGTNDVLEFDGVDGTFLGIFATGGGMVTPHELTFKEDQSLSLSIWAFSGSGSCTICAPSLDAGYPRFTLGSPDYYEDYFTLESRSGPGIALPIRTVLKTLTVGVTALNPDGGGGSPPTGYWEYSFTSQDGKSSRVTETILPRHQKIARLWRFADEGGPPSTSGWTSLEPGRRGSRGSERPASRPAPPRRTPPRAGPAIPSSSTTVPRRSTRARTQGSSFSPGGSPPRLPRLSRRSPSTRAGGPPGTRPR